MKELYNQVHQMDFDKKFYRVRLIENPKQGLEGKIEDASEFAKASFVDRLKCGVRKGDVFLEVEGMEKDPNNYVAGGFYLGMIYDKDGKYFTGTHIQPKMGGGGDFLPTFFFMYNKKLVIELAKKLPLEISEKIKDLYILGNNEFIRNEVESDFEFRDWSKYLKDSGLLN